jgi:hypothetical protein
MTKNNKMTAMEPDDDRGVGRDAIGLQLTDLLSLHP